MSRSGLTAAAARGRFELQVCQRLRRGAISAARSLRACLSHRLIWRPRTGSGELIDRDRPCAQPRSCTSASALPWRVGLVRLDAGVNRRCAIVHERVGAAPCRVRVAAALDSAGQARADRAARARTAGFGRGSQVARTDLRSAHRARSSSPTARPRPARPWRRRWPRRGADMIWAGEAEPWKKFAGLRGAARAAAGDLRSARRDRRRFRAASSPARSAARSIS